MSLIDGIGAAQMEKQIEGKIKKLIHDQQIEIEEQTGGFSDEVNENEVKEYINLVMMERNHLAVLDSENIKNKP